MNDLPQQPEAAHPPYGAPEVAASPSASLPMNMHAATGAHAHVSSLFELVAIFVALLVLTGLTVGLAQVDLGNFNLFITLLIATCKASLVALFFMHLRHDAGFNRLAFFGSFLFVLLFVGLTLTDTAQYQATLEWQEKVLK